MKKYSLLMGLMCAALSITSCSKDNTETFDKPKGYEFELYAAPQTRTEVDGLDMKWSANDAMNVFHAPTGTTNYSSNDQFTLAEIESGRFTGLITDTEFDPNGTYDWYAVYPYSKYMASPAESNSGSYFTVGSEAGSAQQQTGIDNQAHISGENIPLYGTATGVTGSPNLQMHHITTLFRINVTNSGSADLNVTSITLTSASENLIGTYYFDITGAEPVLTSSGDNYVSKTAALNVTDGVVAPEATGSFYLATRAFTAPEGEQLTLAVTANGETVEKVATLSKETTFAAGKINKLNVNVAAAAEQASTWEKVTSLADITAGEYIIANGDYFLPTTTTGSDNAPVPYTLESQGISFVADSFTGIVPDIAKWTFTGTNTAMTITNSGGDYLYGRNANNGIRVGTTSDITWAFEVYNDGFAMKNSNGRYCAIYVADGSPQDWRSYTSKNHNNYQINDGILYLYKKGDARSALETPTGVEAVAEGNEVLVGWNEVSGAASYTVSFEPATIEPQTIESTGEASYAESFTLDYATEYTVSVVANPADTENYKASAPATATFTTGEDPNQTITPIGEITTEGNYTAEGTVVARGSQAYIIADNTGAMMVYHNGNERAVGEKISISGAVELYSNTNGSSKSTPQFTNTATVKVLSTDNVWTYNPTAMDGTAMDALLSGELVCQEVQFEGNLEISGNYMNVTIPGASTAIGSIKYVETSTVEAYNGKDVIIKGYYVGYSSNKYVNVLPYSVEEANPSTDPAIKADPTSLSFAAAGESKEVTYTAENLGSNQVFAAVSGENASQFSATVGNGTVTVTAAENTETTAKTATLTLYIAASEGGEHLAEAIVALTQAGVSSGEGLEPGTILYEETFGTTAVSPFSSYTGTGSSTYENASILTYTCKSNNTKIMADKQQACDVANLMVGGKNGGAGEWAKIGGIKTYNATSVTVTWTANNAKTTVSIEESSSAAVESANSESNTATFALNGTEETITLVITTPTKDNGRVDSFKIVYNN